MITGRLARGIVNVVLALYRRLTTPRGTLRPLDEDSNEDELTYGFDLAQYCGAVGPELAVLIAPGQIAAELQKDDRVVSVFARGRYTYNPDGTAVIYFDVSGTLHNAGDSFGFTVKITDFTSSLVLNG